MNEEIWKDVLSYEGIYQVSNLGNVKSLNHTVKHLNGRHRVQKGRVLSQGISSKGYKQVSLFVKKGQIQGMPVQFIRGKTVDDILIVEEAQNLTKGEIEAILTRLGTTGKIVINGDSSQRDIADTYTGLDFVIELSKHIEGIVHIKLKENHRSGLVGKILDYIYGK